MHNISAENTLKCRTIDTCDEYTHKILSLDKYNIH